MAAIMAATVIRTAGIMAGIITAHTRTVITTRTGIIRNLLKDHSSIKQGRRSSMKKLYAVILAAIFAAMLVVPAQSFAYWGGPCCGPRVVYRGHYGYGYNGAAIAAGVLGGIATGIFLDRVLVPPVVAPAYPPPPPAAPGDAYGSGYSEGYQHGVERGQYERYQQGRDRGYQDGLNASRSGRY